MVFLPWILKKKYIFNKFNYYLFFLHSWIPLISLLDWNFVSGAFGFCWIHDFVFAANFSLLYNLGALSLYGLWGSHFIYRFFSNHPCLSFRAQPNFQRGGRGDWKMGFPKGLSELIYYYYIRLRCKQISSLAAMVESAHNAFSPSPSIGTSMNCGYSCWEEMMNLNSLKILTKVPLGCFILEQFIYFLQ